MSIEALGYVFTLTLPANEKWLAVCLANHADKWGDSIFPALDTLELESGLSRSTIKRSLKGLIQLGVVQRCAKSTPVSPAFYRILGVPEPRDPSLNPQSCPHALRRAVLHAFAARCEYCKQAGTKELGPDGSPWHIDRVVPRQNGGTYAPDNVTLSCKSCNHRKKTKDAPAGTRTLSLIQQLVEGTVQPDPSLGDAMGGVISAETEVQPEPSEGSAWTVGGSTQTPDPVFESFRDPIKAGARAPVRERPPENPADNFGVIVKLAHEVFDLLGVHADIGDVTEAVKAQCARLHIAYWPGDVVRKAIDAAKWQRTHRAEAG